MPKMISDDEWRFWDKVNKNGPTPQHVPELGPCWVWTGGLNDKGYGVAYLLKAQTGLRRKRILAHRLSWEINNGHIEESQCALHKCDNPRCVRPSHLFLGSKADNNRDMDDKGRRKSKTSRGVENGNSKLTEEQVKWIKRKIRDGWRYQDIAKAVSVSKGLICHIKQDKTWTHVMID